MLYLAATGSNIDKLGAHDQIGIMTSPLAGGYNALLRGRPWASDCDALAKVRPGAGQRRSGQNIHAYLKHLERLMPFADTCLFVTVPDSPGCGESTLSNFMHHMRVFETLPFPLAYVLQDGSEALPLPVGMGLAFLGGTDPWRQEWGASMLRRAREAGLPTHVGRVNSLDRMLNLSMTECDSADGTYVGWRSLERGLQEVGGWLNATTQRPLFGRATFDPPRTPFELSGSDEGLTAVVTPSTPAALSRPSPHLRQARGRRPIPWGGHLTGQRLG